MTYRDAPQAGARIAAALDADLAPARYVRVDAGTALEFRVQPTYARESHATTIPVVGAWKLKSWTFGSGIALLESPPDNTQQFSTLASAVERDIAKRIGYVAYWKPLALHLVWCGHGVLDRVAQLGAPMEQATKRFRGLPFGMEMPILDSRVNLVSLTVVDLASGRIVAERHERASRSRPTFEAIQKAVRAAV